MYPELENFIMQCITYCNKQKVPISKNTLRRLALKQAKKLASDNEKYNKFKASKKWI